jgi:hypothetical protein
MRKVDPLGMGPGDECWRDDRKHALKVMNAARGILAGYSVLKET